MARYDALSEKQEITLKSLWKEGLPASEIGKLMGASKHQVWRWARDRDLPLRAFSRGGVREHPPKEQTGKFRKCLRCRERFQIAHHGEFICRHCKESEEWNNGSNDSFACHVAAGAE